MFNTLLPPRGNSAKVLAFVGVLGSIVVNTDTATIHVQDGATAGGFALSKVGHAHASNEVTNWLGYTPAALGVDGKLLTSQLPKIAITDTFVVASQAAMLALTAETGDVAIRTDVSETFILQGSDPTSLAAWVELPTPTAGVVTINGKTGSSVTLTTTDIAEGTNKYYTDTRARAAFSLTAGNSGLAYDSSTGVLNATGLTSSGVTEGSNLFFTSARARGAISLTAGSSGATYNSTTGVLDLSALTASVTVAGSTGQVQYNNAGVLGASASFSFNPGSGVVSATGFAGSGASLTTLNASNLSSGTVGTARLGSGTANSGTVLYGDGTWKAATAGTVTTISVATANGVSGSSSGGSTPALTFTLGDITPSSVNTVGNVTGARMLVTGNGTTAAPSIAFTSETQSDTGFNHVNDGEIQFITNGANAAQLTSSTFNFGGTSGFTGIGSGLTNLNASNLASGTVATARLGTGTASSATFLRGDGQWAPTVNSLTSTQIAYGNGSNVQTSSASLAFASGSNTLFVGAAVTGGSATIQTPNSGANGSAGANLTVAAGDSTDFFFAGPGSLNLKGGSALTGGGSGTGTGGNVNITAGSSNGNVGGNGGDVVLSAGLSGSATNGTVQVVTGGTQRLAVLGNGAWSVGSNLTSTGTAGQVLTSAGNAAAPTWSAAYSDASARAAISLTAGSSGATYNSTTGVLDLSGLAAGASIAGTNSQVQYNNAGAFGASSAFTFNSGTGALSATSFVGSGASLTTLNASNLSSGTVAVARLASSGTPSTSTFLRGDGSWSALTVPATIAGTTTIGDGVSAASITVASGNQGALTVQAGSGSGTTNSSLNLVAGGSNTGSATGGSVVMTPGGNVAAGSGVGNLVFQGNPSGSYSGATGGQNNGAIQFWTGAAQSTSSTTNALVNRFTIQAGGAWTLAGNAGSLGQVLTSGGSGVAPTWAAIAVAGSSITGVIPTATLGTGTATSSNFLRGDGTWAAVTGATVNSLEGTGSAAVSTSTTGAYAGKDGNGVPLFALVNGSAGTDAKYSQFVAQTDGTLNWQLNTDANLSNGVNFVTVSRTGTTATNFAVAATAITLTGAVSGTSFSGIGTNLTALNASNLSSGTVGTARLGTGTANSTTILYGDGTWKAAPSGGGTPGGSTTQVQYNNAGAFAGDAGMTYTQASGTLTATQFVGGGVGLTNLNAANLGSGIVPTARLASTGTASSTTFLRGDGQWATPSATASSALTTGFIAYGIAGVVSGSTLLTFNPGSGTTPSTIFAGTDSNRGLRITANTAASGTTSAGLPDVSITAGNGLSGSSNSGSILLTSGSASGTSDGAIIFQSSVQGGTVTERFRQTPAGAWAFSGAANVGTQGQALISNTATGTPSWGTPVLATNLAGGSAGAMHWQSAAGTSGFTNVGANGALMISTGTTAPAFNNAIQFTGSTVNNGGQPILVLGASTNSQGALLQQNDSPVTGFTIRGGNNGNGNSGSGNLTLLAGSPSAGNGGNVIVQGGGGNGINGYIDLQTYTGSVYSSRLKIDSTGTFTVNGATGAAGALLTSAGAGAATAWTTTPVLAGMTVNGNVANSSPTITGVKIGGDNFGSGMVQLYASGGGTDQKVARVYQSTSAFTMDFVNDAYSGSTTFFNATRSGTTASVIAITGTSITLNGTVTLNNPLVGSILAVNSFLNVNSFNSGNTSGVAAGRSGSDSSAQIQMYDSGATTGFRGFRMMQWQNALRMQFMADDGVSSGTEFLNATRTTANSGAATVVLTAATSMTLTTPLVTISGNLTVNGGTITGGTHTSTGTSTFTSNGTTNLSSFGNNSVQITTPAVGSGNSGPINIQAGAASAGNGGNVTIIASNGSTGAGSITLTTGTGSGGTTGSGGAFTLNMGANAGGPGAPMNLSGSGGTTAGGNVTITSGSASAGAGGDITLTTGGGSTTRGNLNINALAVISNSPFTANIHTSTGAVTLQSAAGNNQVNILTQAVATGGTGAIISGTGNTTTTGDSGRFNFTTGNATSGNSGLFSVATGSATGTTGNITLQVGTSSAGAAGSVTIGAGNSNTTSVGGGLTLSSGNSGGAAGGAININSGSGSGANGGAINITGGTGTLQGSITLTGSTITLAAGSAGSATITGPKLIFGSSSILGSATSASFGSAAAAPSDSNSVMLLNLNSSTNTAPAQVAINHYNTANAGTAYESYSLAGTLIGSITQNGATGVLYNTTSDYRLKNIDGPLTDSGSFIDALKPSVGTWKKDGSKFVGFVAHEFQEVASQSVTGEKDAVDGDGNAVYQTVDSSSPEVMANVVAELQSLRSRNATLEADNALMKQQLAAIMSKLGMDA